MTAFFEEVFKIRKQDRSYWLKKLKKEEKLSPTQAEVIESVYKEGNNGENAVAYSKITQSVGENKSTVSQAITRLVDKKFLNKYKKSKIRDSKYELTLKGQEIAYRLNQIDKLLVIKAVTSEDIFIPEDSTILNTFFEHALIRLEKYERQDIHGRARIGANDARIYDYLSGGQFFFPADKQVAAELLEISPSISDWAKSNRGFIRRSVQFLADQGITQFIDIGSGLLSYGSIHEIVCKQHSDYKILYVDSDPYVANSSQYILSDNPNADSLKAQLRDIDLIFKKANKLEFDLEKKPVAILMNAIIHFIENFSIVKQEIKTIYERIARGSYLVMSHMHIPSNTVENQNYISQNDAIELYSKTVKKIYNRTKSEIKELFINNDLKLISPDNKQQKPDLVFAPEWKSETPDIFLFGSEPPLKENPELSFTLVGVGQKIR